MSAFNNTRRAPNVSQYLANLNTIPSQQDMSAQAEFDIGNDGLDFLTNTEFFDFDASTFGAGVSGPDFSQGAAVTSQQPNGVRNTAPGYQFSEFQTYPTSLVASPSALSPETPSGMYVAQRGFSNDSKRKASVAMLQPVLDLEEQSRNVAEEDKRRRNTAASARFRVKKKQREQALEKQAKEMTDKVSSLEGKIQQLEMENKWLKGLITEKSDKKGMEEQFKLFKTQREALQAERKAEAERAEEAERSLELRNDGVGTDDDAEAEIEA